jgi:predicted permease
MNPNDMDDDRARRDIDAEIGFHLEMRVRELVEGGMSSAGAEERARREFGDVARARTRLRRDALRAGRRRRRSEWMGDVLRDARYGARALLGSKGFAALAVLTIGLGIGAATSIFTVLDAVLLRPLGYARDDRLVQVWETRLPEVDRNVVSRGNYVDWTERSRTLVDWGAFMLDFGFGLTGEGDPLQVTGSVMAPGVFRALGVAPLRGRAFRDGEDGATDEVILSYGLWRSRFGGDARAIGRRIVLDGEPYTVVGVMPPAFTFPSRRTELWLPLRFTPAERQGRDSHMLHVLARRARGVSLEAARAEMASIAAAIALEHPALMEGWGVQVNSYRDDLIGGVRGLVWLLFAAVLQVLLIACANVANLLLVRGARREGELAVRAALGAGRARIARQLLVEHALLALAGGVTGTLLAFTGTRTLVGLAPAGVPLLHTARVDGTALLFAAVASIASVLLFGLLPALRASRTDLQAVLRAAGARGGERRRVRAAILIAQVALSVVLLIGAGLLVRSFLRLQDVDPGFAPDGVLLASLNLPAASYGGTAAHAAFYDAVLERVRALPGVVGAAGTSEPPLIGFAMTRDIGIEEYTFGPDERPDVAYRAVTPDFFETLRMPLRAGRRFEAHDREGSSRVVIVNETFARRFFADADPVGRRVRLGESTWYDIIGVVADIRQHGLDADEFPAIYAPYAQKDWPWLSWMTLVVRAGSDPLALAEPLRRAVWAVDPQLPIQEIATMRSLYDADAASRRFAMVLVSVFALAGTVLGAIGTYGVIAYSVAGRTREIGVRVALGAGRVRILSLVLRDGFRLAAAGVSIGIVVAFAAARAMSALLFGVPPHDALTFVAVPLVVLAIALLATLPPAARAARIDPARTLR